VNNAFEVAFTKNDFVAVRIVEYNYMSTLKARRISKAAQPKLKQVGQN